MGSTARSCILLYRNTLGTPFILSRPQFLQLLERWMISEAAESKMMTEEKERKDVRSSTDAILPEETSNEANRSFYPFSSTSPRENAAVHTVFSC